jgi:hypothetical protein
VKKIALAAALLLALGLAFAATTLYALEGREVVVLRTKAADGSLRETRTWVADADGSAWIEAAFADRPFYQQLLADPQIEVVRGGSVRRYRAVPMPNPDGHVRIRHMLADKYGWADWWVGLLTDTSGSIAVRLDPVS